MKTSGKWFLLKSPSLSSASSSGCFQTNCANLWQRARTETVNISPFSNILISPGFVPLPRRKFREHGCAQTTPPLPFGGSFDATVSETTKRGAGRDGHPRRPSAFQGDLGTKAPDAQPIYRDFPPTSLAPSFYLPRFHSPRSQERAASFPQTLGSSPRSLGGSGRTGRQEIILPFALKTGQMRIFISILFPV